MYAELKKYNTTSGSLSSFSRPILLMSVHHPYLNISSFSAFMFSNENLKKKKNKDILCDI